MREITLLVADDEAIVRAFINKLVTREKAPVRQVLEAGNGLKALELALEHKPDLVFLDIRMPGMDGLQAAEAILQALPGTMVVMVTAHGDFDYARSAFRAGVEDYLLKPIRASSVLEYIHKAQAARVTRLSAADAAPLPGNYARPQAGALPAENAPPAVHAAVEYIRGHLHGKISLSDVSKAVFVSQFHLSRMFARHMGKPLMEYAQDKRLAEAEKLLRETSLSVSEIAEQLGYSTLAYFSGCFRKKFGQAPSAYRKSGR